MKLRFLFMVYITVLVGQSCLVKSIFLPWSKSKNDSSDGFRISIVLLELNKNIPPFGVKVPEMKNMTSNISVDERCFGANDMPLSFAFHKNHPYTFFQSGKGHIDVKGMFPSLLSNILDYCCHGGAKKVKFAKLLRTPLEAEDRFLSENVNEYDFTFSIHAPSDVHSFRDYPFIPLVRVPSVVFLAYDGNERTSKTHAIATTIMKAWPIMVFILLTATFSGIIIWFLDHRQNPQEFPQSFKKGVWEGFWWALVTMTTVGYGDRSPKSTLGRVFCILWIITGLIIISIFTAMVTASLAATTHPYFPIHGSLIGVVNGSEEYQLGVLMNAEMKIFPKIYDITNALLKSEIDGAFVDSFIITAHLDLIRDHPGIRIERTIEHPVTYGMVLAGNSSRMERCARRYVENYPRKVFQKIAKHLKPLKNPSDAISQEVKAAEGLFYEEGAFKMIVYSGTGILAVLFIAGLVYEILAKKYFQPKQAREEKNYLNVEMTEQTSSNGPPHQTEGDLDELLQDYKSFHDSWVERCKRLHGKPYGC